MTSGPHEKELTPYKEVTPAQHKFVLAYLIDFNVSKAAKSVGVTPLTGTRWLKLQSVKDMIDVKAQEIEKTADVTLEDCVRELKEIAFFDLNSYIKDFKQKKGKAELTFHDFQQMNTRALQSINVRTNSKGQTQVEIKPYNKVEALKELISHLKGYKGPSTVHLHLTEEMAKNMSGQEITANYQQLVNPES
jgi:phage terminase small subunit